MIPLIVVELWQLLLLLFPTDVSRFRNCVNEKGFSFGAVVSLICFRSKKNDDNKLKKKFELNNKNKNKLRYKKVSVILPIFSLGTEFKLVFSLLSPSPILVELIELF